MYDFPVLIATKGQEAAFATEILSLSVLDYVKNMARELTRGNIFTDDIGGFLSANSDGLIIMAPAPAISADTLCQLACAPEGAALVAGHAVLAVYGKHAVLREFLQSGKAPAQTMQPPMGEALCTLDCESAYAVQEQLRRMINFNHMKAGVRILDPATTFISPLAELAAGTTVLPGCQICKKTRIGENCRIGPNTYLENAVIGNRVSVNASQVFESNLGDDTTVGPFAYIRPGCTVGQNVRIGDFVELKNSTVGNGTKISHLTYIGDSDLGKKINVGCGVVTVNYDGKEKHRTTVKDNSFVGCNVNLVSPVTVGEDAYLAAGSTVTSDVPSGALVIARARETVKAGWTQKRRDSGKL